ncbi:hypothetical protein IQ274_00125 [Nostoc sp. LEGE 12447]|uniref:DUF6745 domain-containing protein n=1 Tax=Nostoc sp. LEGE 12447 TaxID=1828640 RepID=UPI001882BD0C|nr:hypothetical protein [Nostoc sp. LEGE 12447]MBE8996665.1 hypothetical protein [Nostoc sp. LEGE 12447]
MSLIENLTPEQEALIPVYREKWRAIALSTERIDKEKAAEVVKAAYTAIGKQQPEIIFCDSPYAGLKIILKKRNNKLNSNNINLNNNLINYISTALVNKSSKTLYQLDRQVIRQLTIFRLDFIISEYVFEKKSKFKIQPKMNLDRLWLKSQKLASDCCWLDFYISVLNCSYSKIRWKTLQSLSRFCGWISPFENLCIICDRPLHLRFDNENHLHAEGEPAIEFTDGYSLYSYHGVTLPEKYGKIHPQQWQATWLLTEENAELRRVLIQGIGYARICQELQAIELDTWQEYTLLKIDADVDEESIHLLKMTCPSTGFIHALRVPPNMKSAREAIRWVNWGVDPEAFGVQT